MAFPIYQSEYYSLNAVSICRGYDHDFSRRTAEDLAKSMLFRRALPAFHSFLDLNVEKEVDKDGLAIYAAAAAQKAGESPSDVDIGAILESARAIDEVFSRRGCRRLQRGAVQGAVA